METTLPVATPKQVFGEEFAYVAISAIMLVTYATINLSLFVV